MTVDNPTLISLTYGAVRVATVATWEEASAVLHKQISDAYRPNGRMSNPNDVALAHERHELAQVAAGPQSDMIVTSGPWAWGDSIRAAQLGEHGLTAGDLAILHDYSAGYRSWTIDVKVKIIAVCGDPSRPMVRVRVTDWSASQLTHGDIITVSASRIRRRSASGRR